MDTNNIKKNKLEINQLDEVSGGTTQEKDWTYIYLNRGYTSSKKFGPYSGKADLTDQGIEDVQAYCNSKAIHVMTLETLENSQYKNIKYWM